MMTLIVHPFNKDFSGERISRVESIDQLVGTLAVLVDRGREHGVNIAVENIDEPYSSHILAQALSRVEGLMLCFDTGHAQRWQARERYIPAYLDRISALHIHDNHGIKDDHPVPGDGVIDFVPFFKSLKASGYAGYLGIECAQKIGHYGGSVQDLAHQVWTRMQDLLAAV